MDELLSEKEQIDQMRAWWSEYAPYVIGGVVVAIAGLFGANYYKDAKLQAQLDASAAYESLVTHVGNGNLESAEVAAGEMSASFSDSPYAGQAGLAMARLYMDKNRDQDAADALLAVINGSAGDELKSVARLRLARIYLYQDKAQEVVDLLGDETNASFAAAYGEVLGDAYTALGNIEAAQSAYQNTLLDPLAQGTVDRQLVQWKALDLPKVENTTAMDDPTAAEDTAEGAVE